MGCGETMPRLKGLKPAYIIDNVFALDGYCGDNRFELDFGPSATWDEVAEAKRYDNDWRSSVQSLNEYVATYGEIPRPVIVVLDMSDADESYRHDLGPTLCDGHHRVIAALDCGLRYVPTEILPQWDRQTIQRSWRERE